MKMTFRVGFLSLLALGLISGCQCNKAPPATAAQKNEGEACAKDDECTTGLCDAAPGRQQVCVRKCSDACDPGDLCTQLTPGRFSCAKDHGGLCQTCAGDSDCPYPSDRCIVVDGKGVCGRDCAFDQTCPTSYRCLNGVGLDGQARAQQCTPTSGSCNCTAATAGQMISCQTTNTLGTCHGFRTCDGVMGYGACDARQAAVETCNGIDDDCNGKVDDGLPAVVCGVGECQTSVTQCGGDGGFSQCVPKQPTVETCNGKDDDCDGVVDNGFDLNTDVTNCRTCGHVCALDHATPKCAAGDCEIASCTMGYDNCNGAQSDGCETNLTNDVNNCGTCQHHCMAAGATSSCVNSQCTFACQTGYLDLDGDPSNGCEYQCTPTSTTDLPDLAFTDANCDGIDGEVNNGIFVSPAGDDAAVGDMTHPVATIDHAVALAKQNQKRDVYVSLGSFNGPLTLTSVQGKNLAGAYSPGATRWTRSALNATIVSGGNPALVVDSSQTLLIQEISFRGDSASGTDGQGQGLSAYGATVKNSTGVRFEKTTLTAGAGSAGTNGTAGSNGGGGNDGNPGIIGCQYDTAWYCSGLCTAPSGGAGGTNNSCTAGGGKGGAAGWNYNNPGSTGVAGYLNTPAGQGAPGNKNASAQYSLPTAAQRGANGAPVSGGSNGTAPGTLGSLTAAGYLPPLGGAGLTGPNGNGGGGGGGGGGGCQDWEIPYVGVSFCACYTYGSSGGGGGAGGCGGTGGTAGGSGGASVALMLWNSSVSHASLTLVSGRGGAGGNGGSGGSGGTAGKGKASVHSRSDEGYAQVGGTGGDGSPGGVGGAGAGGAGGPSLGVLRDPSSSITNTSAIFYTFGTAGAGGSSTGASGPSGVVQLDTTL
jgi:hypothetical protein